MLEEGLINHPVVGFGESGRKASEVRILLAKIEESEVRASLLRQLCYIYPCECTYLSPKSFLDYAENYFSIKQFV